MPSEQFADRVVVVTGAASGIGRATALEFASRGAAVALVDRDRKGAEATAAAIEGVKAEVFDVDVSNAPEVEHTVGVIATKFGGIDILAHAAGIQRYGTAASTSDEVWHEVMAINVTGAFHVTRAVLPHIVERGGGAMVVVGSVQSLAAVANSAAYVTSKHAILGLVRSIALDFAKDGIRANCVCPGAIDTPMLRWAASLAPDPDKVIETCSELHLFHRLGSPEEVARVIAFLASPDASFITGQAIAVDGGALVPVGGAAFVKGGTGSGVR